MAKTCYIIGPIGEPKSEQRKWADFVRKEIIKPVVKEFAYAHPMRSDKDPTTNIIMMGIIKHLFNDDLVFADLTDSNANVLYELGIRDCMLRPVIHLIKAGQELPFDVAGIKAIHVDKDEELILQSQDEIRERIEAIETDPNQAFSNVKMWLQGKFVDVLSREEMLLLAKSRVEDRLTTRRGRHASFEAIRNEVNPRYDNGLLQELIKENRDMFLHRRIKSHGPGIKLIAKSSSEDTTSGKK